MTNIISKTLFRSLIILFTFFVLFILSAEISFMDNIQSEEKVRCYAKETNLFVTEGEDITEWGWKHTALIAYFVLVPVLSYYVTWHVEDYFDISSRWVS